jgi:hypothetical protein
MRHGSLLDRFILALRDGDWPEVEAHLGDPHTLAVRVDGIDGGTRLSQATDRGGALQAFVELFDGAGDLTLLVRIASEWYVFGEYLVRLEAGGRRRIALVQSVEDGRLTSTFGYGRDEAG